MRSIPFAALVLLTGCLDFGEDVVTTDPSDEQIAFCRTVMHIDQDIVIHPIGLKILGSGIDDAVWFKFETPTLDPELIFDADVVCPDSLWGDVSLFAGEEMPDWWDTRNRFFHGGTFSPGGGVWMTVGFQQEADRTICYIFWHET